MRHRSLVKKLGRSVSHRKALMATLVCALIERKRIKTTLPKAKEARRMAERLVTLARVDSVAGRRRAVSRLRRQDCVKELFEQVAPRYTERPGGYTRITKLGPRKGDGAEMALLEWVDGGAVKATAEPAAAAAE